MTEADRDQAIKDLQLRIKLRHDDYMKWIITTKHNPEKFYLKFIDILLFYGILCSVLYM